MLGRAPLMRLNALGTLPPLFRKNATAHMEPGSTGTRRASLTLLR